MYASTETTNPLYSMPHLSLTITAFPVSSFKNGFGFTGTVCNKGKLGWQISYLTYSHGQGEQHLSHREFSLDAKITSGQARTRHFWGLTLEELHKKRASCLGNLPCCFLLGLASYLSCIPRFMPLSEFCKDGTPRTHEDFVNVLVKMNGERYPTIQFYIRANLG